MVRKRRRNKTYLLLQTCFVLLIGISGFSQKNNTSVETLSKWENSSKEYLEKYSNDIPKYFSSYLKNSFKRIELEGHQHKGFYESMILFVQQELKFDFKKDVNYLIEQFRGENKYYFIVTNSHGVIELKRNGFQWEKVENLKINFDSLKEKFNSFDAFTTCDKDHNGFFYYLINKFNKDSIEIKLIDNGCSYSLSNNNGSN